MPISDFVVVTVTKEGGAITRQGFGTPVFMNENSVQNISAPFATYADLAEILTAGFATTDSFYKWATVVFSQNPSPARVASGWWDITGTVAIDVAITAIETSNSPDWYFIAIDDRSDADITLAATTVEALRKVFIAQTSSSAMIAGTGGNIGETLRLASRERVSLWYHDDDTEYMDAAICGIAGAADLDAPGGVITFALKQLSGVPTSTLTTAQQSNITAENANYYVQIAGRGVTNPGTVAEGEFLDVQTTLDWTFYRIQEGIFRALSTTSTKVPYTNEGIALIAAEINNVLDQGVTNGHYSSDTPPTVITPDITEAQAADKDARILRGLEGRAVLAGAIHQAIVVVRVTA
jgi:hypothetical protein